MDELCDAPGAAATRPVPVHIEWECSDLDRSEAFFCRVFLWQFEGDKDVRDASYRGQHIGTLVRSIEPRNAARQSTTVFVSVPSIEVALERVVAEGGQVRQNKVASGAYGFEAVFVDPDGNRFGLFESVSPAP